MNKNRNSITHTSSVRNRIRRKNSFLFKAKISKKDSFLIALSSIEAPGPNLRKCKRNSFLIASELLSFEKGNEKFEEPGQKILDDPFKLSSTRSKSSRRDSFLLSMDNLEFSKLDNSKKYDSQLFLSELLDLNLFEDTNQKGLHNTRSLDGSDSNSLHNETFTFHKSEASKRRNSFLKISRAFDVKRNNDKKKKKRSSLIACFDTDFSKPINQDGSDLQKRKRRRLSAIYIKTASSPKPVVEPNRTVQEDFVPKNNFENENDEGLSSSNQNPSSKLISFCQAMRSSEESQTRIHNWDKKMGLRRSHSKTMRNSMRSRKKLLNFCSNQIFQSL